MLKPRATTATLLVSNIDVTVLGLVGGALLVSSEVRYRYGTVPYTSVAAEDWKIDQRPSALLSVKKPQKL